MMYLFLYYFHHQIVSKNHYKLYYHLKMSSKKTNNFIFILFFDYYLNFNHRLIFFLLLIQFNCIGILFCHFFLIFFQKFFWVSKYFFLRQVAHHLNLLNYQLIFLHLTFDITLLFIQFINHLYYFLIINYSHLNLIFNFINFMIFKFLHYLYTPTIWSILKTFFIKFIIIFFFILKN